MSGFAVAVAGLFPVVRRVSGWASYLRRAALADFGCAIAGVFAAAQLRFGATSPGTYMALSLALPVLWIGRSGSPEDMTPALSGPARTSTARS